MTLGLALLLPLAAVFGLLMPDGRRLVLAATPWVPLTAVLAAVFPPAPVTLEAVLLGLTLELDLNARLLLAGSGVIWIFAGLALARGEPGVPAIRLAAWHLTLVGNIGALAAVEATGFYLFFALLSVSVYGVLVRDRRGRTAGRLYLAVALSAEMLFLAGAMLMTLDRGGTAAAVLVLFGLGAKLGLLPLHFPLPPAYAAAGAAGGAVFAGALTMAAAAGLGRFLPVTAPEPGLGTYAVLAGLAAAFLGAAAGVLQRDPRALLGYSTVSQMGLFTLALGLGLVADGPWPAAALTLFALHHGLVKGALMLGTGTGGALVLAVLAALSLALAGAPHTGGALAKAWFGHLADGAPGPLPAILHGLLPLTATATALLMARFVWLMRGPPKKGPTLPFLGLAALALLAPPLAGHLLHPDPGSLAKPLWSELWPLLLAAAAALAGLPLARRLPRLPPGDIANLGLPLVRRLEQLRVTLKGPPRPHLGRVYRLAERGEQALRRMPVTGLVLFALTLALVLAWKSW